MKPPIFNASSLEIYRILANVKDEVTAETVVAGILFSSDKNELGETVHFLTLSVYDPIPNMRDQTYHFVGSLTTTDQNLVDILGGRGEKLDYQDTLLNLATDPDVRKAKYSLLAA